MDERPLLMRDIEFFRRYFNRVEPRYFHIFTLLTIPFRKTRGFEKLLKMIGRFDEVLMKMLPFTKRYAWTVLLDLGDPRR
jgi:hypothetical protein